MTQPPTVARDDPPPDAASYLHGSAAIEQRRLARRTAALSAAFFLPHWPSPNIDTGGEFAVIGVQQTVSNGFLPAVYQRTTR
jgi:hypothetical protein